MDVITTHLNADFDAFASMVAAKKLYPDAVVAFAGSQEKSLRDFFVTSAYYAFKWEKLKNIDLKKITRLILVDIRQKNRIGQFARVAERPDVELHIYDHHPPAEDDLHGSVEMVREVGATTTLLCGLLRERKLEILPEEATIMMLGIYEDTGSLTFPSTTEDDFLAAAYLKSKGADLNLISDILVKGFTAEQISLLNELVESATTYQINGVGVVVATVSSKTYVSDFAVLVHKLREMERCDVLFVLARMEDRVYLVARSRKPEVDVGDIAKEFGGGGHSSAASATVRDQTLIQVEEKLKTILQSKISPPRVARDFMSYPVKTVDASETLSRAGQVLTRYNINVLPVMKDGRLAGLISRQVIEKATHHGLKELPVEEYMVRDFATAGPQTPWPSIQKIIIEGNQRFLPVLHRGKLIGGITRTDLLRVLHADLSEEPQFLFEEGAYASRKQNKVMVHQLEEHLPPEMVGMLKDLGEAAEAMGVNAYLVGGFVRDIFLRRNNLDVDLVIEGDGIAFAQQVAVQHKARVKVHKTFGTAVISLPGGFKVDVASARLEYYERPAALPQVEMSSIKLDLYRRDFTINTLAIRLNPAYFGELIDFFGARKDIKEKTIRVIHNLSFVEDPTRILRAIRFEQRFGFHLGRLTQSLIENAVRFNFLERLDGRRLLSELILVLQEEEVILNLERMQELSLLRCIHPAFTFDKARKGLCERIKEAIRWYELSFLEEAYVQWKIYFMALIDGLGKNEVVQVCRRLFFSEKEGRELLTNREHIKNVLVRMVRRRTLGASELYHLLKPLSVECLIYLMGRVTRREAQKAISTFITQLRHTAIETGGEDLKKLGLPPGRLYKKILDGLLDARLEGKVQTKADEIDYVRRHFLKGGVVHGD